jgi:CRP/FNR family transcriptional regulator, cyclic AMP receptor protein
MLDLGGFMTNHAERPLGAASPAGPALSGAPPTGFLSLLTNHQRRSLLELGAAHLYRRGQVIMREGGPADIVVVVLDGLARVTALSEDGKEILLGFRGGGDLLGEMGAVSSSSRSATVTAATDLRGTVIRAALFVAYLERSPRVANRVSDSVAGKLRAANRRRLEFNAYPAESRVARILAEIAVAHGHREGTAWRIGREITQADVASLASTSVRTVEKILSDFEGAGIVVRRRRDLIVTDPVALETRSRPLHPIPPRRDS